jgi:plastocyanin
VQNVLKILWWSVCAVLCLSPASVLAFTVQVKDSHGNRVENAIVSLVRDLSGESSDPMQLPIAIMDQKEKQFVPKVLLIEQGQLVSFPNSDNIRHHVYSFSEPKKFEIKLYADTPKEPILFEEPGVVVLGCNIHDSMSGYIFVSPWHDNGFTNEQGRVEFSGLEPPSEFAVWHPRLLRPSQPIRLEKSKSVEGVIELVIELRKEKTSKFKKSRWR